MSKATELAHVIECGHSTQYNCDKAAALLRTQDALLRQALEAFDAVAGKGPLCNAAVKAIKEHLK